MFYVDFNIFYIDYNIFYVIIQIKEVYTMFSYKPLLRLLVENDMTKTQLREATGMSMNTLAKISKKEYVSMSTLDSICKYFHCKVEDIIEFIE